MPVLKFRDPNTGNYIALVGGAGGGNEVTIDTVQPTDGSELWVDSDAPDLAGVVDHGLLAGLGDDDHPQYALKTAVARGAAHGTRDTDTSLTDGTGYTVAFESWVNPQGGARYRSLTVGSGGVTVDADGLWLATVIAVINGTVPSGTARSNVAVMKDGSTWLYDQRPFVGGSCTHILTVPVSCVAGQVLGMRVVPYTITTPVLAQAMMIVAGPI